MCLIDFRNFLTIHVFGVKESIADIFLQSYHVWVTSRHVTSCHVIHVSHVMLCHVTSCHVISPYLMSCHVMSRNVTSCHIMSRHVTSCHVTSTSCHVMSRHATSRSVTSCHVMSRHVMLRHGTSCYVMARHATSWHVMSRRKSRGRSHDQRSIVNWLFPRNSFELSMTVFVGCPWRLPIPYRISGIWSSYISSPIHPSSSKGQQGQ